MIQISLFRYAPFIGVGVLRNATFDPSGDTAGHSARSTSLRGLPPITEIYPMLGGSFGPPTHAASRCVPSGNQARGLASKPAGRTKEWVSPVSIWWR
jgi:hypothetical protein